MYKRIELHEEWFPLDLQFFAKEGPNGEKTEEPTAKKLEDARKEGQVGKSREVATALGLLSTFAALKVLGGSTGTSMLQCFSYYYVRMNTLLEGEFTTKMASMVLNSAGLRILTMLAPFFLIGFLVAFVSDLMQVKWKFTAKPMKPKFSKMNPIQGFKRIFSMNSVFELIKSIFKVVFIVVVVYNIITDKLETLLLLYEIPFWTAVGEILALAVDLGLQIAMYYLIIALADFAYQKYKFKQEMKMTKQEVKDEYKNTEGDPQIKSKQKQRMREASQRRMMASVPTADVVITNPTHFAVALKYNAEDNRAPVVVAKGEDFLAKKIKDLARESHVEIVENKPLARMLYYNVDVDAEIPPELYQAVAEVLAYVYSLKK